MATLTFTDNAPLLFSDNAGQLQYTLDDSEVIYLVISGKRYQIPVADSSGTLEMSDILRGAPIARPAIRVGYDDRIYPFVTVTAGPADISDSTGRATVNLRVLRGGIYGESAATAYAKTAKAWLTLMKGSSSEPRPVSKWGKEFVSFHPYEADTGGIVTADVLVKDIAPTIQVTLLNDGGVGWDEYGVITVDSSFDRIRNAILIDYPSLSEDRIWGWELHFRGGNDGSAYTSQALTYRLIQTKSNYREFIYRNSLGSWDSVYSKGAFKVVPQYNFASFRNRNKEGQLDSLPIEHMEIDSGPLATAVEQRMWLEMISSDEVYLVDQSGDIRLIILDESSPSLTQKELNSLTVKCHYAERVVGNGTRISIA